MTIDSADIFESDHQYKSNLESDVRFEIKSNHEASQVPTIKHPVSDRVKPSFVIFDIRAL